MVISIIAILASMLLPAIGSVRSMATTTTCTNGQRQVMMANILYAEQSEDLLPNYANYGSVGRHPHLKLIVQELMPNSFVITADGIWNWADLRWPNPFQCPNVQPETPNRYLTYGQRWMTDNVTLGIPAEKDYNDGAYRLSQLNKTIPFLADTVSPSNPLRGMPWSNRLTDPWAGYDGQIRICHRNQTVVTWPDGHVAARTRAQLLSEDKVLRCWSPP